ncbi:MAG: hypothetical protein RLZZ502_1436 [Pseudomonadota bacterium]|jgi:hypothetical protein
MNTLDPDRIFLRWCAVFGLLMFITYVLWRAGIWDTLNSADSTGITQAIVVFFFLALLWLGNRSYVLRAQEIVFLKHREQGRLAVLPKDSWAGEYLCAVTRHPHVDKAVCQQTLGERVQGRHEIAWWVNGLLLKLGLLGTVAGFILMSLQVGKVATFDLDKIQTLLKGMTYGMGVALLTTLVGLCANIILGWMLLLLDREGDKFIVAVTQAAEAS